MFYGEYEHSLDKKGRLIVPSRFREIAKNHFIEKFYVNRGLDKCLFMFTEEEWKNQEAKLKALSFTKSDARKFNRLYFSGASEVVPDGQGRILIPKNLKEFAGIKKDVVLVGVSNMIEIWDSIVWKDFYNSNKVAYEEIAEKIMDNQ